MACRHGVVLCAANMYRGETYRLVAFFHMMAHRLKILFFCYDVICRYWPFARKLAQLGKAGKLGSDLNHLIATMVDKMLPFLSRFHGQAHAWFCQVSQNDSFPLKTLIICLVLRSYGLVTFKSMPLLVWGKNKSSRLPCYIAMLHRPGG